MPPGSPRWWHPLCRTAAGPPDAGAVRRAPSGRPPERVTVLLAAAGPRKRAGRRLAFESGGEGRLMSRPQLVQWYVEQTRHLQRRAVGAVAVDHTDPLVGKPMRRAHAGEPFLVGFPHRHYRPRLRLGEQEHERVGSVRY